MTDEEYREAARAQTADVDIEPDATVHRSPSGAFVSALVWVPASREPNLEN